MAEENYVICKESDLINIANTVRSYTGETEGIALDNMSLKVDNAIKSHTSNLMEKNLWKMGWNYPDEGYDGFSVVKLVNTTPIYYVLEVDNTTGLISGPETSFSRYYEMEYDEGAQEFYFQPQSSLITNSRKYNYALFKVVAVKNESGGYTPVASYTINDLKRISVTDELAVGEPVYLSEIPDYNPNGMLIVYTMY